MEYGRSHVLPAACAGNASAFFHCLRGNFEKGVVCLLRKKNPTIELSHCVFMFFLDIIVVSFMKDKSQTYHALPRSELIQAKTVSKKTSRQTSHDFPLSTAKPARRTSRTGLHLTSTVKCPNERVQPCSRVDVCPSRGEAAFHAQRAAFFVPAAAACSVDIITARVSLTVADWLRARDQEKVTGVKLLTWKNQHFRSRHGHTFII